MKYLKQFLDWLARPSLTPEERYLSQATDACDLERRIKDLQIQKYRKIPYL